MGLHQVSVGCAEGFVLPVFYMGFGIGCSVIVCLVCHCAISLGYFKLKVKSSEVGSRCLAHCEFRFQTRKRHNVSSQHHASQSEPDRL